MVVHIVFHQVETKAGSVDYLLLVLPSFSDQHSTVQSRSQFPPDRRGVSQLVCFSEWTTTISCVCGGGFSILVGWHGVSRERRRGYSRCWQPRVVRGEEAR